MIFTPQLIIFLSISFVLVWLFANTIDKRKWIGFLISVIATPIVYFYVLYPLMNIFFSFHHQKHFNASIWKEKPAFRYEMSNNIIADSMLIGKSKAKITSLLGPSEWYSWDDSIKANSQNMWNYNLGFKPGAFNTDQECLELIFKNGKVAHTRQYQMEKKFE